MAHGGTRTTPRRRRDEKTPKSFCRKKLSEIPPLLFAAANGSGLTCVDDLNAAATAIEMHVAIDQGVERKIAALSNAVSGMELVADLANEDVSGSHLLATESLHTATLGVRVTSVSAGALPFFMCHEITSPHEVFRKRIAQAKAECLTD
jgi:hypothetical protein